MVKVQYSIHVLYNLFFMRWQSVNVVGSKKKDILFIGTDMWGVDNRKGHNYQNHDFELTQLLYAIHHGD